MAGRGMYSRRTKRSKRRSYKRKPGSKRKPYSRTKRAKAFGLGKGRHNFLQSAPVAPAGLWAPEVYTTLSTAWDEPYLFSFPLVLAEGQVGKDKICALAKIRASCAKDSIATMAPLNANFVNGDSLHIMKQNANVNVTVGGFLATTGNKPVGYNKLQEVYARQIDFRCQASFTLMVGSSIDFSGAQAKDVNLTGAWKIIKAPSGGVSKLQYIWFGVSIVPRLYQSNDIDAAGLLKTSINDMMTQEGTIMKLVNITEGNPSCTIDIDVDLQKWYGTKITDASHGYYTADSPDALGFPNQQLFLVPWVAPVETLAPLEIPFNRNAGTQPENLNEILSICDKKFCLHAKMLYTSKLFQQRTISQEPAPQTGF